MTQKRHVVLCGGVQEAAGGEGLRLDVGGPNANVRLEVQNLAGPMSKRVPDFLRDLLEIAAYVFTADQAFGRGPKNDDGTTWRRRFELRVPVRDLARWSRPSLVEALVAALSFMSEDEYAFSFTQHERPDDENQLTFEFGPPYEVDEVALFSGGLDSLAGAIDAALLRRRRVALVSHDSATKRKARIGELARDVAARAGAGRAHHIAVHTTKSEKLSADYTQRSRVFLYTSLAAAAATMLGRDRINVYENGVTSINLPIAAQVVGARATRTTHPVTIARLARFFSELLGHAFAIETPFLWKTKTDVVRLIDESGCGELIGEAMSCSRTIRESKDRPHCGTCAQCIDRRFATLAAGVPNEHEPADRYDIDVFTSELAYGEARTMAESFVQRGRALAKVSELDFFAQFGEAIQVVRHVGLSAEVAGQRVFELHRRHAQDVSSALAEALRRNAGALERAELPTSCLLVMAWPYPATLRPASSAPTFRRRGDVWHVSFENEETGLKDETGLRYLEILLRHPGQDLHVAQLVAGERPAVRAGAESGGEVTDVKSVRAYRARLEQIVKEMEQARSRGEADRLLELDEERDRLARFVRTSIGRSGGARSVSDEDERARSAVSKAIARARKKIANTHPPFARHLRKHLKTGMFCSYSPNPPVTWITC